VNGRTQVAVIGTGALGTVFAWAAERGGAGVTVCARTPVESLTLEIDGGTTTLATAPVTDPAAVGPADWVLVTTKTQDTASAGPWLDRLAGPDTTVVVLQNGIGRRERVAPLAPAATVVPAVVYLSAERAAPGHVVHRRNRRVLLPPGPWVDGLAAVLPGIEVTAEPDFATASWRKLLANVAANPITALTLRRVAVLAEPEVRELVVTLLREAVAVGRAEGARLTDEDIDTTLAFYDAGNPDGGTSMLYDRLAGRPMEHEEFSGVVTRLGRTHGIPTPANQAMYALLGALP
jgi:2-dehydropantoate 2-reductase